MEKKSYSKEKTEFKIESGVPMPIMRLPHKYPFDEMKIGDSFFVKDGTASQQSNISYSAKRRGFTVRTRREGRDFRVWRVK